MTKQQIIEEAYGNEWKKVKSFSDENGWIEFDKLSPWETELFQWEFKEGEAKYWRVGSLSNLELNNGWTKVESIEDMPKGMGHYFFMLKNNKYPRLIDLNPSVMIHIQDLYETITHFQKMEWPSEPIY